MSESLRHTLGRLAVVEARVHAAVARRRAVDPDPDDGFRGLYLADHHVDALLAPGADEPLLDDDPAVELLAKVEAAADHEHAEGRPTRLRLLRDSFGLTALDVDLLVIAALPDIDARFEKLYGYLHDDVTQKRASVGLALELAGVSTTDAAARARLGSAGPLVRGGLVEVDADSAYLRRVLRAPDRVVDHLLGGDHVEPLLAPLLGRDVLVPVSSSVAAGIGRGIEAGSRLCALRAVAGGDATETAVAGLAAAGFGAVVLDLSRLGSGDDATALARVAARDARLRGAGVVAGPYDVLAELGSDVVRAFGELPCVTVLTGTQTWDPLWSRQVALLASVGSPTADDLSSRWQQAAGTVDGEDVFALATQFRFDTSQVGRAAESARLQSALDGAAGVTRAALFAGARAQNAVGLERLAKRVCPAVGWEDLVLPPGVLIQLQQLADRARHRDTVLGTWGMRRGGGRGRGISGLFAGDSGTGKTLSAEVLAGALGLDLYTVNLATVVDKYIGETEKNLERIFTEADGVNGVLLFDEADALFGKRSEVKDARDRYANIEVAYLLQRMESFNGLAILSSNLKTNLDDAFARRLDAVIDFPEPSVEDRERLWDICLGATLPRADDVDLAFLAASFQLSGGNIRSICTGAAYLAAASGGVVTMGQLVTATQGEYRKLGRLIVDTEFGSWL